MESANSMRPPLGQTISSQPPQQKRPRTPTLSPSMPSPESDIANSSRHVEIDNTSEEPTQKSVYEAWTEGAKAHLFQWLELPGNYDKWKCAGVKSSSGSTRTLGLTKKAVIKLISQYLDTLQTKKTPEQVMSKMRYVEKKFKEAEDYLRNTGEGLTTFDEKMGITLIQDKVLSICPFYYQVKPFMSESVAVNPPYIGETGINENFEDMLFGTSTGQGLHESRTEDRDDLHCEDDSSSAEEDPDFEAEIFAQEPIQQAPSQGIPPVPEATQSRSTPRRQPKEKKKKPKSFQEFVQELQEQNRVLMEKKLDTQLLHHDSKYQFLREESQKKFAIQSRRLDLEFMRMDQQRDQQREEQEQRREEREERRQEQEQEREESRIRKESRIREVALQIELAKLRASS